MYNQNVFTGIVDESGNIWDFIGGRKNSMVGVDTQKYQELQKDIEELQEITDGYYNKLVELGVITPPKTAEELAQEQINIIQNKLDEQTAINTSLVETLKQINQEIKEMRGSNSNVGLNNTETSSKNKQKPARDKKSD